MAVSPFDDERLTRIELWPEGAPGAVGNEDADRPMLAVYLPPESTATGSAVVVCPGGGYCGLATDHEGAQIGQWLNQIGIAAFVLRYRIAPRYRHPYPLLDAQRAMRTVRARAKEWKIDPGRIGVWGFSAGGHLAATVGTHFDAGQKSDDVIERASCRPDFLVLSYAVVTMAPPYAHMGSRANLIGDDPASELVELLSNEMHVTERTPPTFLFHTDSDPVVCAENSVLFYLALRKAGVPAEMHIYPEGPHGVGLAQHDPVLSTWAGHLGTWLLAR